MEVAPENGLSGADSATYQPNEELQQKTHRKKKKKKSKVKYNQVDNDETLETETLLNKQDSSTDNCDENKVSNHLTDTITENDEGKTKDQDESTQPRNDESTENTNRKHKKKKHKHKSSRHKHKDNAPDTVIEHSGEEHSAKHNDADPHLETKSISQSDRYVSSKDQVNAGTLPKSEATLPPLRQPLLVKPMPSASNNASQESVDDYSWDTEHLSAHLQICPHQANLVTRKKVKQSTDGARGSVAVHHGKAVYVIQFSHQTPSSTGWGSHCAVGVCTKNATLCKDGYCHLLGGDRWSWGWDIPSGQYLHDGRAVGAYDGDSNTVPRRLALLLDMEAGTLSAMLDPQKEAVKLFTDLGGKELYPAVSMVYAGMRAEISYKDGSNLSEEDYHLMAANLLKNKLESPQDINITAALSENNTFVSGSEWAMHSTNMYIQSENPSVLCRKLTKQSTDGARGRRPIKTGQKVAFIYQFDLTPWGSHCSVGVCDKHAKLQVKGYAHLFGMDEHSWAWDIPSRKLLHNKSEDETCAKDEKLIPKVLALLVDMEEGTVSILIHPDMGLQSAFSGLKDKELYAAVSMVYGGTSVTMTHIDGSSLSKQDFITKVTSKLESVRESLNMNRTDEANTLPRPKVNINHRTWNNGEMEKIQLAHGWDLDRGKGANISVVPNTSTICSPKGLLDISVYKMEALRCRQALTSGIHRWKIQQIRMWHVNLGQMLEDGSQANDSIESANSEVAIGVVNEHHSKYNYGYLGTFDKVLQQAGRGVWMWDIQSHYLLKGHTDVAHVKSYPKIEKKFDINKGIMVVLDVDKGELSFEDEDGNYGIAFQDIKGSAFYPFLLFKNPVYPVQISYLDGPDDHIEACIRYVNERQEAGGLAISDIVCHRPLSISNNDLDKLEKYSSVNEYAWKTATKGLCIMNSCEIHVTSDLPPEGAYAESSLTMFGHQHEVQYVFLPSHFGKAGKFFFGVVSADSGMDDNSRGIQLGNNFSSWGWDMRESRLWHAGHNYAKYPWNTDYAVDEISVVRMTVNMKSCQKVELAFAVQCGDSEEWQDLGVAFSDLPSRLVPAMSCSQSSQTHIRLDYTRGPSLWANFVPSSSCCIIQ